MTREEFVEQYRHEFAGMIAEALVETERGGALGLRMRMWFKRVDRLLGEAYEKAMAEKKGK